MADVDAQAFCLLLIQGQKIDSPAEQKNKAQSGQHGEKAPLKGLHVCFGKASHKPEGDLLKHVVGIGNILDHGYSGVAEGHDHRACENQDQRMGIHGFPADQIGSGNSSDTSGKSGQLNDPVGSAV